MMLNALLMNVKLTRVIKTGFSKYFHKCKAQIKDIFKVRFASFSKE
jgi:hypothetical protein